MGVQAESPASGMTADPAVRSPLPSQSPAPSPSEPPLEPVTAEASGAELAFEGSGASSSALASPSATPRWHRGQRQPQGRPGQGSPGRPVGAGAEGDRPASSGRPPRGRRRAGMGLTAALAVGALGLLVAPVAAIVAVVASPAGAPAFSMGRGRRRGRPLRAFSGRDPVTGLRDRKALQAELERLIGETPPGANLSLVLVHVERWVGIGRYSGREGAAGIRAWGWGWMAPRS